MPPPGGGPRRLGVAPAPPRRRQAPPLQPAAPAPAAAGDGCAPAARQSLLDRDGGERRRYLAQLRLLRLSAADQLVLADLVRRLPCVGAGLAEALRWVTTGVAAPVVGKGNVPVKWRCPEGITVELRPPAGAAAVASDRPIPTDGTGATAADDTLLLCRDDTPPPPSPTTVVSFLAAALHRQYTAAQLCIAARDRLVVANLLLVERVVAQVVSRYGATPDAAGGGAVPPADLAQEGALALVRATASFDPDRGIPFVHYAGLVIRAGVVRSVENHGRLVRLPVLLLQRILRVQRRYREIEVALAAGGTGPYGGVATAASVHLLERVRVGGELTPATATAMTASVLGIPRTEVERLAQLAQAGASLDATFSSGGGCGGWGGGGDAGGGGGGVAPSSGGGDDAGCLLDGLESRAPLPEQAAADAEAACTVRAVMERLLDADERAVMTRLYGLCLGGEEAPGAGSPAAGVAAAVGGRGTGSDGSSCCCCGHDSGIDKDGDAAGARASSAAARARQPPVACVDVQTKAEIGRNFGWSRSRVRTVERRALSKMRHSELRGYRDVY